MLDTNNKYIEHIQGRRYIWFVRRMLEFRDRKFNETRLKQPTKLSIAWNIKMVKKKMNGTII